MHKITERHSVFKNAAVLTSTLCVNKALMFFFIIFLARFLGSAGFGKFAFAFSFTQFFYQLADFGLNMLMIREITLRKDMVNAIFVNSILVRVLLGLITLICIVVVIFFLNKPAEVNYAVLFFSISIILNSFMLSFVAVFRAFEKMIYEGFVQIMLILMYIGMGVVFVLNGKSIAWVAFAHCISSFVVCIICFYLLKRNFFVPKFDISKKYFIDLIVSVWPFGIGMFFVLGLTRMSVVMVSLLLGDKETGFFQGVYSIVGSINLMLGMVIVAAFPRLTAHYQVSIQQLRYQAGRLLKLVIVLIVPCVFFISYFSDTIIHMLFGKEYAPAGAVLKICVWTVISFFTANLLGNMLIITRQEKKFAFSSIGIFFMGMFLFSGALIIGGLQPGAYAVLVTDFLMALTYGYLLGRIIKIETAVCMKVCSAIAVFLCVFAVLRSFYLVGIIGSFVVYFMIIKHLHVFRSEEIAFIKNLMRIPDKAEQPTQTG